MGLSGLEPPTSRLSGVRSNRLSYKPKQKYLATTYSHRQSPVYYLRPLTPSLLCSIWIQVFPISASSPGKIHKFYNPQSIPQEKTQNRIITILQNSLKRRWSSHTFRYGYLVTTSPQSLTFPSATPPLRLGHELRELPTPMVWRAVCTRPGYVFTATCWFAITSDSSFM